ncbi:MAG: phosphotransferase [Rickettsiaceae bacterium]|nr:phosphotransferase [Rickettsiaceae bacterium]MDP4832561.1 phosphotransferase [Rickettsiaceae bacterium]MDP5020197.1 phosphotransferase [Rickettsiaceae bacterium]MDP5082907.1 phosphotransferase [Rickettsiaceae bacterium]
MVALSSAERESRLKQFVDQYFPQASSSLESILGDAGQRSYYRMAFQGKTYVIMDCPPSYCSVGAFVDVGIYLQKKAFSVPQIIHKDIEQGFLILEDFGPLSVKNYLLGGAGQGASEHQTIYHLIIDLLVSLQSEEPPSGLVSYDNELLLSELKLFVDWYIPHAYGREVHVHELEEFMEIWLNILESQAPMPSSMVLRDYHVENMMYLEERKSIKKLGLLDFQDALTGSPIYDLVSVLEDARIQVPRSDALRYVEYFSKKKEIDIEKVLLNYHILGAQRNSRILGIFARKAVRDHDASYLQYIPRVLKYLEYDLSYVALAPLKDWLDKLGIRV